MITVATLTIEDWRSLDRTAQRLLISCYLYGFAFAETEGEQAAAFRLWDMGLLAAVGETWLFTEAGKDFTEKYAGCAKERG